LWSDEKASDQEKVTAFKFLNELTHRVWNIFRDIKRNEDDESIIRLFDNLKCYAKESELLSMRLWPAILLAYDHLQDAG
jgi:hypothetical protein